MTNEILKEQKIWDKLKKEWIQSGKIPNSPLHVKGGGGVKGQKDKLCLSYRVFFHEFNGFRFVKKFQVLFELSRRTRGENDDFRTQNWAKINVNKSK